MTTDGKRLFTCLSLMMSLVVTNVELSVSAGCLGRDLGLNYFISREFS